jgi:hypothetical protein
MAHRGGQHDMKRTSKAGQRKSRVLRLGLPKGSLQQATLEKMAKAGWNVTVSSRSYLPYVDDPELEIRLIRAQEVSRYVEHGYLDCGITGYDWVHENGSDVHEVGEFLFSKATRQPADGFSPCRRTRRCGRSRICAASGLPLRWLTSPANTCANSV